MDRRALFSNELHQSTAPFPNSFGSDLGFVSKVLGQNRDDGASICADVTAQYETMFDNVQTPMGEFRLVRQYLVRTTLYLVNHDDLGAVSTVYDRRLSAHTSNESRSRSPGYNWAPRPKMTPPWFSRERTVAARAVPKQHPPEARLIVETCI